MKASKAIIQALNQVLGLQLISINQTFLHARILKNWGFESLGKKEFKASIDAMKIADELIERVLFLEGLPNLQHLGKLLIGEAVPEILKGDLDLELRIRSSIQEQIALCEKEADFVSRDLLTEILESTEERIDFIENEIELTAKLGIQNYLQTIIGE